VSDLSELIEQLADGPVLLATDRESADADWDNGTTLQHQACAGLSKFRKRSLPCTRVYKSLRTSLG
jgi:hypothetical protein